MAKWLAALPEAKDPKAINSAFKTLESIAARSPIIADDVLKLKEAIRDGMAAAGIEVRDTPTGVEWEVRR